MPQTCAGFATTNPGVFDLRIPKPSRRTRRGQPFRGVDEATQRGVWEGLAGANEENRLLLISTVVLARKLVEKARENSKHASSVDMIMMMVQTGGAA